MAVQRNETTILSPFGDLIPVLVILVIILVGIGVGAYFGVSLLLSETTTVSPEDTFIAPVEIFAPEVVQDIPLAETKVEPTMQIEPDVPVAPIIPALELDWVEIGQARNGKEVRALPIPWDRVVIDRGTASMPTGTDRIIDWLREGNYNLPPANNAGVNLVSAANFYLLESDKVILYAYSNYRWSKQDPQVLSYWKVEVALNELEGLRP